MEAAAESVVRPAVPGAHQVGGLLQAVVRAGGVVDGVGKALAEFLVHFAVNVGLDGEHVGRREMFAALQRFVDALDAIGIAPFVCETNRGIVGGDAGICRGEESGGRIECVRH